MRVTYSFASQYQKNVSDIQDTILNSDLILVSAVKDPGDLRRFSVLLLLGSLKKMCNDIIVLKGATNGGHTDILIKTRSNPMGVMNNFISQTKLKLKSLLIQ